MGSKSFPGFVYGLPPLGILKVAGWIAFLAFVLQCLLYSGKGLLAFALFYLSGGSLIALRSIRVGLLRRGSLLRRRGTTTALPTSGSLLPPALALKLSQNRKNVPFCKHAVKHEAITVEAFVVKAL